MQTNSCVAAQPPVPVESIAPAPAVLTMLPQDDAFGVCDIDGECR